MTENRKEISMEKQVELAQIIKNIDVKTAAHSDIMTLALALENLAFQHGIDFVLDKVLDNIVPKESLKWYERIPFWLGRKGFSFIIARQFSDYWEESVDWMTDAMDKLDDWANSVLNRNNKKGLS